MEIDKDLFAVIYLYSLGVLALLFFMPTFFCPKQLREFFHAGKISFWGMPVCTFLIIFWLSVILNGSFDQAFGGALFGSFLCSIIFLPFWLYTTIVVFLLKKKITDERWITPSIISFMLLMSGTMILTVLHGCKFKGWMCYI
jgi:hypothetical protein